MSIIHFTCVNVEPFTLSIIYEGIVFLAEMIAPHIRMRGSFLSMRGAKYPVGACPRVTGAQVCFGNQRLISTPAAEAYPAYPSCRRECSEHRHYFR
jgi:hypothetical protein